MEALTRAFCRCHSPAGKAVEFGRFALGADVLLHPVELVCGHIELIRALIADVQKIAVGALRGQAHRAHILAHAMVFVDDIIADGQVGKRRQFFAVLGVGRAISGGRRRKCPFRKPRPALPWDRGSRARAQRAE